MNVFFVEDLHCDQRPKPLWLVESYRGWNITQSYRDYFRSHEVRIPINQHFMESQPRILITAQFLKATPRTGVFFCFWALNPSRRDLGKLHPALFVGFFSEWIDVSFILDLTKIHQFIRLIPFLPHPFGFGESSTNHCGQKWSTHATTHPTQVFGILGGSSPLLLDFRPFIGAISLHLYLVFGPIL